MQLKPEIATVLESLGADENEVANLVAYFTDKLTAAEGAIETIERNIASLQVQLQEEQERASRVRAAILKFVVEA